MKPIIGILAGIDNDRITKLQSTYTVAIEKSGGVPIILPYIENEKTFEAFAAHCDGFLFSGGGDVDPKHYGEERKETCGGSEPYRDAHELAMFKKIAETSKPILAICRGIQLVNVALGGTLYQDIPTEKPSDIPHRQTEPKDLPSHSVTVKEDTPLFKLIGKTSMNGNSFHHQAVKDLGNGLSVMATTDDGIIEAVYLKGEQYLRAYQWHPERLCNTDTDNKLIFDDFINACMAK